MFHGLCTKTKQLQHHNCLSEGEENSNADAMSRKAWDSNPQLPRQDYQESSQSRAAHGKKLRLAIPGSVWEGGDMGLLP